MKVTIFKPGIHRESLFWTTSCYIMLQTAFWNTAIFRGFLLGTFSWFKFNFPFRLVFIWWLSFSPVEKYVQVLKAWLSVVLTWLWSPSELHLDHPRFSVSLQLPRDVPGLCQMIHQLLHALVSPCQAPSVPCSVWLPAPMPSTVLKEINITSEVIGT